MYSFETVTPVAVFPLERRTEKHCPAAEPGSHKLDRLVVYVHFNMGGSSLSSATDLTLDEQS